MNSAPAPTIFPFKKDYTALPEKPNEINDLDIWQSKLCVSLRFSEPWGLSLGRRLVVERRCTHAETSMVRMGTRNVVSCPADRKHFLEPQGFQAHSFVSGP